MRARLRPCGTSSWADDVQGQLRREILASWDDQGRAGSFVSWLDSRVERGVPGAKSWTVA
ncbi:hypothetical protein [Vitiosangium sp. GDMCC 1.1324]|uniref:hypothetical protein n=1 Tax=Vitiosangium sp. (strain GDMCC 1.1324) TaxID=2138576 RepID=UPI000D3A5A52|nr:hypothetical protein [Vitiosangium sp. GDMCC 1.1324]PTL78317.1 hypothetical protein DAT35_40415 [Vitiosangium sp. GDMCC 1.1324]